MNKRAARWLDQLSTYLSTRKGLLPLVGALLVILNLLLVIVFPDNTLSRYNIFLHIGVITAIAGFLIAKIL